MERCAEPWHTKDVEVTQSRALRQRPQHRRPLAAELVVQTDLIMQAVHTQACGNLEMSSSL